MSFGGEDTAVNEDEIIWMKGWQQNLEETHEPELDRLRKEKTFGVCCESLRRCSGRFRLG